MAQKRTLARISERFIWNGMVKDVQEMVSVLWSIPAIFALSYMQFISRLFKATLLLQAVLLLPAAHHLHQAIP